MPNVEMLWSGAAAPAGLLPFSPAPPVLAQFAYGFGVGSLLGIGLVFCGLALYLLRSMRPNLARDHDIFFAAVSLLCGGILFFQGWRLDPILQFGQFLMTGSAIFFAVESIRLRGIVTQQAKRSTPVVDDDRPVSRNYRTYEAELEEIEPYEARPSAPQRRIAGSRDGRQSGRGERSAGYDGDARGSRSGYDDRSRPDPRERRRPEGSRDLNLRFDKSSDRGYGDDDYGSRRARPSRSSSEMSATLEGYDTYTPDRPSDSPYDDRDERPTERDRRRSSWDNGGSDYDDPYRESPRRSRPGSSNGAPARNGSTSSDRTDPRSDARNDPRSDGRNDARNDDFAEFYRDDDDYAPPSSDDPSDREPEYGA